MSTTLSKPKPSFEPFANRTAVDEFVREREATKAKQLKLDRESDALAKQVRAMDQRLIALVDAEAGGRDRTVTLKHFRLSIIQVAKSVAWKSEFRARNGQQLVDELEAAAGTRDKFQIESR